MPVNAKRSAAFWLHPAGWMRACTLWWVPALLGLSIAVAGVQRLVNGGVALSWRGLRDDSANE